MTTHKSLPGRSVLPSGVTILPVISRGGVLVKEASKIKVNPVIVLDFEKDVILEINLTHGQAN